MQDDGWGRCVRTVVAALLLAAPTGAGGGLGAQELDAHLGGLVPFGFSGAVLVVEGGSRVVHEEAYGFADRNTGRPNTTGTVFDIGSLSKQFTAAAVLALVEQGVLSVDDPIGAYIPYVPEDKRGITLHHLLTHTSGLPPFHAFGDPDVLHGDFLVMTRHGAERAIMGSPLDFPPGEGWTYSNSGYTLLAAIAERAAGRPFEEILRTELFEPAGLSRTGLYFQGPWDEGAVAHGYRESRDQGSPLAWTGTDELWALIGNGGVLSTVEDLGRWHRALREGTVLPRRAVDRLFAPHVEVRDGLHYGYGWYIEEVAPDIRVIRHGGANDFGFAARWRRYVDRDRLVVLLMNREPPGMDVSLAASAVEGIVDAVVRGEEPDLPPAAGVPPAPPDLDRYVGRYRVDGGGEVIVGMSLGTLTVEPRGPVPTRHLAFPAASRAEMAAIADLDRRAREILDGLVEGNYGPLEEVMADPSRLGAYRRYLSGWWEEFEETGAGRDDVEVLGTVPSWWSPGDERLATVIVARAGDRSGAFRLHWQDGRVAGLGGGAVRQPATTLFAPAESGAFVGYHLGIRRPVRLSFEVGAAGRIVGLRLETGTGTVRARKLED